MDKRWPKAVENGLHELSTEEPDSFQFEHSMAQVHQHHSNRRTRIMRKSATTLIPIGVVAVIFAALLLIPATYTMTVGSVVDINIADADHSLLSELEGISESIPAIEHAMAKMSPDGLILTFVGSETNQKSFAKLVETALEPYLEGQDYTVSSKAVTVERGGNALAAITGGVIRINTEGLSDEQIEAAIAESIMGMGMEPTNIDVQTSADGTQREIRIEMEGDIPEGEEREFQFEFDDDDGSGGERIIRREIICEDE